MTKYTIVDKDGLLADAACVAKAVRIRERLGHIMWPSIPRTTLLFSDNKVYSDKNALSEKGDIDVFDDFIGNFSKAVKPNYG